MTQILPILSRRSFVQTLLQGQVFKYNLCFIVTTTLRFPITKISRKNVLCILYEYFYCEKEVALEVKKLDQGKRADCASVIKGY